MYILNFTESFQDQENVFSGSHCYWDLLVNISHSYCGVDFHKEMQTINKDTWCVLENIIRSVKKYVF